MSDPQPLPQPEARRRPANPVIGLLFALGFLVAAVLGVLPLITQFVPAIGGDLTGQRTEGFILLGPLLFGALGVFGIVRAVRRFAPWRAYRAQTTPDQRRRDAAEVARGRPVALPVILGIVVLLGQIALLVFARFDAIPTLTGKTLYLEVNALLLLAWAGLLGYVGQTLLFRRGAPPSLD